MELQQQKSAKKKQRMQQRTQQHEAHHTQQLIRIFKSQQHRQVQKIDTQLN